MHSGRRWSGRGGPCPSWRRGGSPPLLSAGLGNATRHRRGRGSGPNPARWQWRSAVRGCIATLILSFLATLGATTSFTLTVLGDEGIGNRVTAYVFVFLVALGIDYNVFIMSRFKQELRSLSPAEAIGAALTRTGGVVSSADLTRAATFAVLMTQPIRELFQLGFAMAFGILLPRHRADAGELWPTPPLHGVLSFQSARTEDPAPLPRGFDGMRVVVPRHEVHCLIGRYAVQDRESLFFLYLDTFVIAGCRFTRSCVTRLRRSAPD